MLKRICLALAIAGNGICVLAQSAPVRFTTVVADTPSSKSCSLVRTDAELEQRLKQLGWQNKGSGFPDIDWNKKVAAVVAMNDVHFSPIAVALSGDHSYATIRLNRAEDTHNSGIFVLELDSTSYATAGGCGFRVFDGGTTNSFKFMSSSKAIGSKSGAAESKTKR